MPTRQSVQQRTLSHSIDLFTGGMDSDASPYRVAEGQAVLGENVEFYRDNTLRSRKGYALDTTVSVVGQFITQRIGGEIKKVYRDGDSYNTENLGVVTELAATSATSHNFVRVSGGVLVVERERLLLLDPDGLNSAGVDTPLPLTGGPSGGGQLKEGSYVYIYNYLLKGGQESPYSDELKVQVEDDDSKVTLTIPTTTAHPKLFKLRLYRKDPGGGFPLFIKELEVGTTSFVDEGEKQSALIPIQGIRKMPGGNLALIANRRLLTVKDNTLNYSYPGNYGYSNVFWNENLNLPSGEPITAICPLGQGVVFFGLETALYMNGFPSEGGGFNPLPIPDGCVSQTAWTQAEDGTLLYVGKSGVYAMQGASAQRISDPVNTIFDGYTIGQLANVTMIYDQQNRRLLVGLPNEMLVFYFQTKAWAIWTLPNATLDWFEGRTYMYYTGKFGVLGENNTDNGSPIMGRFVSGVHGLDDAVIFKLFRRMGIQVSAGAADTVEMGIRALESDQSYMGLPPRTINGSNWDAALWNVAIWSGNEDTTQTVSLPDNIQGRYLQFTITFTTYNANSFVITGPVVVEYRTRYRYGR